MSNAELLDEVFYEVTERTRELVDEQTPRCCDWDECLYGSDIEPTFGVSCGYDECIFRQSYEQAVTELLNSDERSTQFLTGCYLQTDLNFYSCYFMEGLGGGEWQSFVATMGRSFVHQRVFQSVSLRSTLRDNPGRAISLVDQVAAQALNNLIKHPLDETDCAMDSWAASWKALDEIANDPLDRALLGSQIGKVLPLNLRNDKPSDLFDETIMNVSPIGRYNVEGVVMPDTNIRDFSGAIIRAFIAEKIELEFPGDFEAFMNERREVIRQRNE
ncbi:MAG TPA: hypothetical protein VHC21_04830 [Candidatus Saccharimonadales bacterium]|nr:hypothetical protein [Candidatus Saccharimonadales bacterium]